MRAQISSTRAPMEVAVEVKSHIPACPIRVAKSSLTGESHAQYDDPCQDRVLVPSSPTRFPILAAICDGHGECGDAVSEYIVEHLPKLMTTLAVPDFVTACEALDHDIQQKQEWAKSGSTATAIWITQIHVTIGQTGDSVAWGVRWDPERKILLSHDLHGEIHRVNNPQEHSRIINAGGTIQDDYVTSQGNHLAVTRSLGDHDMGSLILSTPHFTCHTRYLHDLWILLATDGIWEHITSQHAADLMAKCLLEAYQSIDSPTAATTTATNPNTNTNTNTNTNAESSQPTSQPQQKHHATEEQRVLTLACDKFVDTLDDADPLQDDATIVLITLQPLSMLVETILQRFKT